MINIETKRLLKSFLLKPNAENFKGALEDDRKKEIKRYNACLSCPLKHMNTREFMLYRNQHRVNKHCPVSPDIYIQNNKLKCKNACYPNLDVISYTIETTELEDYVPLSAKNIE